MTYVGYDEAEEMRPDESPPVGILLCADRNATAVRYTVGERAQQVFASRYQLHLPTEEKLGAQVGDRMSQIHYRQ